MERIAQAIKRWKKRKPIDQSNAELHFGFVSVDHSQILLNEWTEHEHK